MTLRSGGLIKALSGDFVMVPLHEFCRLKPAIRPTHNYARDNHLKRVSVSTIWCTEKELKMLYYYPSFHLYQRQEFNSYPWAYQLTHSGSSPYVSARPPFYNSPCYRECIRSGADSYFCCYICGFC